MGTSKFKVGDIVKCDSLPDTKITYIVFDERGSDYNRLYGYWSGWTSADEGFCYEHDCILVSSAPAKVDYVAHLKAAIDAGIFNDIMVHPEHLLPEYEKFCNPEEEIVINGRTYKLVK